MTALAAPVRHSSSGRREADFPYRHAAPDGCCELCHQPADELARVVIEEHHSPTQSDPRPYRCQRVILVCDRHPGELAQGEPVAPPRMRTFPDTSAKRPQAEALFDSTAFKR